MYYYGARYYDPGLGVFLSVDPQMDRYPAWSPYAYTLDNPVRYVDPSGEWPLDWIPDAISIGLSGRDMWNDPSMENAGLLALDIVTGVTPYVPAVGLVRHGDEVAEIAAKGKKWAKGLSKADDAVSGAKKAADAPTAKPIHGNSLDSPKETVLYDLQDAKTGEHLKYGITSANPPLSRYPKWFMEGKYMRIMEKGSRREMYGLEKELIRINPGRLNKERWARKVDL